jgi:hypothetical protein
LLRAFTELNVPHRISFRVMMPFQISIWFISSTTRRWG